MCLAALAVLTVATGACATSERPSSTIRLAVPEALSLDPAFADDPTAISVASACYQPLFTLASGAPEPTPGVAAIVRASNDQRSFALEIRSGVTFADGRALSANDVAATIERVRDPKLQSPLAAILDVVSDVRVQDATRLTISTRRAFRELPVVLSHPGLGVVDARFANDAAKLREQCAGTGDYTSTRDDAGRHVLVRRRGPGAERIALVAVSNPADVDEALARDRVDVGVVDAAQPPVGDGYRPYTAISFVALNPRAPGLTDARVREAIVRALDSKALTDAAYAGRAEPLATLVPPTVVGANAMRCVAACSTDRTAARALLAAVYPDGQVPPISFDYDEGEVASRLATEVARELREVGIVVAPVGRPAGEYGAFLAGGGAQVFRFGWVGQYPGAGAFLQPLFASSGSANVVGPIVGVDAAIEAAQVAPTANEAAQRFADAADAVLGDWIVKPVATISSRWQSRSPVTGLAVQPLGSVDLAALRKR